ncbi:BamA/TamA family outer membrane protein [Luteibaculum oceani]|uniref:BamA/TamA family outer membrane protein n=1 Tax=Luteibaculum oceani TaxID=1294296 RepID=UPI0014768E39|nr:BamA/TamA family outer membrane protein [Luteibaculum oceani]
MGSLTLITRGQDSLETDLEKEKNAKIFPIPIAFYTPETGLGLGAGVTSVVKTKGGDFMPRKSQLTFGFAYTSLKQLLMYVPFSLYTFRQKMYLQGELGYFDYTFRYFGITNGTKRDSIEFYRANFPRVRINAFAQIADGVFVGPRLVYDKFSFSTFNPEGRLRNMDVPGSEDHFVGTIGVGGIVDKRDNNLFPTSGYYGALSIDQSINPDYKYTTLMMDFTKYFPWSNKGTFAINLFGQSLFGEAPFTAMPKLGGTKKLRGYFEGSILQEHIFAWQAEARRMVWKRLGFAAFFGAGNGFRPGETFHIKNTQISSGLGLRIRLTDQLNARLDYAIGMQNRSGFYITFGEAF